MRSILSYMLFVCSICCATLVSAQQQNIAIVNNEWLTQQPEQLRNELLAAKGHLISDTFINGGKFTLRVVVPADKTDNRQFIALTYQKGDSVFKGFVPTHIADDTLRALAQFTPPNTITSLALVGGSNEVVFFSIKGFPGSRLFALSLKALEVGFISQTTNRSDEFSLSTDTYFVIAGEYVVSVLQKRASHNYNIESYKIESGQLRLQERRLIYDVPNDLELDKEELEEKYTMFFEYLNSLK